MYTKITQIKIVFEKLLLSKVYKYYVFMIDISTKIIKIQTVKLQMSTVNMSTVQYVYRRAISTVHVYRRAAKCHKKCIIIIYNYCNFSKYVL